MTDSCVGRVTLNWLFTKWYLLKEKWQILSGINIIYFYNHDHKNTYRIVPNKRPPGATLFWKKVAPQMLKNDANMMKYALVIDDLRVHKVSYSTNLTLLPG